MGFFFFSIRPDISFIRSKVCVIRAVSRNITSTILLSSRRNSPKEFFFYRDVGSWRKPSTWELWVFAIYSSMRIICRLSPTFVEYNGFNYSALGIAPLLAYARWGRLLVFPWSDEGWTSTSCHVLEHHGLRFIYSVSLSLTQSDQKPSSPIFHPPPSALVKVVIYIYI